MLETIKKEIYQLGLDFQINRSIKCPWFPQKVQDLNLIGKMMQTIRIDEVNPFTCHTDAVYRQRFNEIVKVSNSYQIGSPIPTLNYTKEEDELWNKVYTKLRSGARIHATKEMNSGIDRLERDKIFTEKRVPDLEEVN